MPAELDHVIGVVAVGPSGKKADYSNWGAGQADLAAPGGFLGDLAGTPAAGQVTNMVLSASPRRSAGGGDDRPDGHRPHRRCRGTARRHRAYWRYLEGTSMAAPHVAGGRRWS